MKRLAWLAVFLLASSSFADTNTPYPAGTTVSVTTSAGTVTGKLEDINAPQWISVREPNASEPTLIRGLDVILRKLSVERPLEALRAPARTARRSVASSDATAGHYVFGRPRPSDSRFRFTPPGHSQEVEGITSVTLAGSPICELFAVGFPSTIDKWLYAVAI
jgi:hypothetical protein